jgi:hypothetical protein
LQAQLMSLKDMLMELELDTTESVQELCAEFDRRYSELAEGRKTAFNAYMGQVGERAGSLLCQCWATAAAPVFPTDTHRAACIC